MKVMAVILGLGVAGCMTVAPENPTDGGTCRNDGLPGYAGRAATAELGADILRTSGAKTLQWVAAGTAVTMEYRQDRVRVYLDEANRVQRASCG